MATPRIDLIGIATADLAASLAFYRRLGLDIPGGVESEPHVEITLAGGLRLAWDPESTIRAFDPEWAAGTGGRVSLAFDCGDASSVDATYADMVGAGYHGHLQPFDAFWGQRYAVLADPDGNGVDLFAPLPA